MTEHPGDSAESRFRSFWAGLLVFLSFGLVALLVMSVRGDRGANTEPKMSELDQQIVQTRLNNRDEVTAAQEALVSEAAIEKAKSAVIASLAAKKPQPSALVVPNSPTFIKQMQQSQQQPAPAPEADKDPGESAPADAPKTEQPAAKPAPKAADPGAKGKGKGKGDKQKKDRRPEKPAPKKENDS